MPTLPAVPALAATATLPAVATLPATATLPAVAALPAAATDPTTLALPATATLPTTSMLPTTAALGSCFIFMPQLCTSTGAVGRELLEVLEAHLAAGDELAVGLRG